MGLLRVLYYLDWLVLSQLGPNFVHFAPSCCHASLENPTESSTRPPRTHKTPPDYDFPRFSTPPEPIFIDFGTLWTPIPLPFHSTSPYQPHNRTNATTHQPHYRNNALVQARWRMLRSTWIYIYIYVYLSCCLIIYITYYPPPGFSPRCA